MFPHVEYAAGVGHVLVLLLSSFIIMILEITYLPFSCVWCYCMSNILMLLIFEKFSRSKQIIKILELNLHVECTNLLKLIVDVSN